jgi:hypothetical protein
MSLNEKYKKEKAKKMKLAGKNPSTEGKEKICDYLQYPHTISASAQMQ